MEISANRSMMRCDVWRVWMNDLWKTWSKQKDESDEYGGNKPLLMIIDQCFTMQRWIGKNWPICTRVFTKKKTWKIWIIGWMWMNLGPTSNDWREQLALTLILSPNSVTQCVVLIYLFWIYLIFMDIFYLLLAVALIVLVKQMKLMLACCDLFSKWIFTQWVDMRLFDCMHIIWGKRICWKYWCLMFPCMALAKSPKLSISTFLSGGVILCITAAQCVYHGIT